MRPVDFSCILRVSKSQMLENGTKDAAVDGVYRGVLDYLSSQSHKVCSFANSENSFNLHLVYVGFPPQIAYPELIVPCVVQLKSFLKKSKVANYSKKIKQLVEKLEENSRFICQRRKAVTFGVGDAEKIENWEKEVRYIS